MHRYQATSKSAQPVLCACFVHF